ncbi:MAG: STAS domain-containing protein [Leptospirales bacterium]|jgi:anti-anti-sigma factor
MNDSLFASLFMKLEIDRQPNYAVLRIREPYLNFTVGPELRSVIQQITGEGVTNLVLDMTEVSSADSSGLSAFVAANRICRDQGGILILIHICLQVEKIIGLARLEDVLQTAADLAGARATIEKHHSENRDPAAAERMQRYQYP